MKKILFLFVALIMSVVSSWAAPVYPEAGKIYKIHCLALSGHQNAQYVSIVGGVINSRSATGTNLLFEGTGVDDQWYIKDVETSKYLVVSSATSGTNVTLSETASTYWTASGPFHTDGIRLYANGVTSCWMNNNGDLALRGGTGECSSWVLEEYVPGVNVTYHYVLGTVTKDVVVEQIVGETAAAPAAIPFATLSYGELPTVAPEGNTINVTVTENLPFATGFEGMGLLHVHSNQNRYAYTGEQGTENEGKVYHTNSGYTADNLEFGFSWWLDGNVLDGFVLGNMNGYIKAGATTEDQATVVDDPSKASVFQLREPSSKGNYNYENGFCLYTEEGNFYLNARSNNLMKGWTSNDQGSTFELENHADVTITDAGYATFYYHTPVMLAENVKGYTLTLEGEYLVASEIAEDTYENAIVPAGTPVVLEGAPGNYQFDVDTYSSPAVLTSALTGSYVEKNTPANCYALAKDGDDVLFAQYTGAKVEPFKAYYVGSAASNLRISFDTLTSIISAAKENGGQAIFDLQGRRVVNAKGINIVNGKKVIR